MSEPTFDRAALEALIAANYRGLRALIARRVGDPEVGADLLNDAVEITWTNWQAGKISRPEQIAGYIFETAMNLLRNHRRNAFERKGRRADSGVLEHVASASATDRGPMDRELVRLVREQIENLPTERDRTVVLRFYLREQAKEEICRELQLKPLQFDKIIFRARRRLRLLFESGGFRRSDFFMLCLA